MRYFGLINLFWSDWCDLHFRKVLDKVCHHARKTKLVLLSAVSSLAAMVSCSSGTKPDFKNPDDAMREYHLFVEKLTASTDIGMSEFISSVCSWQEMSDKVFECLNADPSFAQNQKLYSDFTATNDSIRSRLGRMPSSMDLTFDDVVTIKEKTNSFRCDSSLVDIRAKLNEHCNRLMEITVQEQSKEKILTEYRNFLQEQKRDGIHSREKLLGFILIEDVLFRSFLAHLPEYTDSSLVDITSDTEEICRQIFENVDAAELDPSETLAYMTARTNRRLLLNARTCINDIRKGKVGTDALMAVYQWMILQPIATIEGFSLALMSEDQMSEFHQIARDLSEILSSTEGKLGGSYLREEMPRQIVKLYITSL